VRDSGHVLFSKPDGSIRRDDYAIWEFVILEMKLRNTAEMHEGQI
jgi:hypothetical protein